MFYGIDNHNIPATGFALIWLKYREGNNKDATLFWIAPLKRLTMLRRAEKTKNMMKPRRG